MKSSQVLLPLPGLRSQLPSFGIIVNCPNWLVYFMDVTLVNITLHYIKILAIMVGKLGNCTIKRDPMYWRFLPTDMREKSHISRTKPFIDKHKCYCFWQYLIWIKLVNRFPNGFETYWPYVPKTANYVVLTLKRTCISLVLVIHLLFLVESFFVGIHWI